MSLPAALRLEQNSPAVYRCVNEGVAPSPEWNTEVSRPNAAHFRRRHFFRPFRTFSDIATSPSDEMLYLFSLARTSRCIGPRTVSVRSGLSRPKTSPFYGAPWPADALRTGTVRGPRCGVPNSLNRCELPGYSPSSLGNPRCAPRAVHAALRRLPFVIGTPLKRAIIIFSPVKD